MSTGEAAAAHLPNMQLPPLGPLRDEHASVKVPLLSVGNSQPELSSMFVPGACPAIPARACGQVSVLGRMRATALTWWDVEGLKPGS